VYSTPSPFVVRGTLFVGGGDFRFFPSLPPFVLGIFVQKSALHKKSAFCTKIQIVARWGMPLRFLRRPLTIPH